MEELIEELIRALGKAKVKTKDFQLIPYSRDWSPRDASETQMPQIVVRPASTEEVSQIITIANKYLCPVTTMGGLTGMGGGAVPTQGGIALDTKGLNKVLEIDSKNMTVTTQTGITVLKLNEALKKENLWWPHDPESKPSSTVGAAIACDNDSTFGIKYGKIGDFLLNAKVVLGTGEILRVGHRKALCTSTGYKLHWLLIASEGTLGVITEATLKIFLIPETRAIIGVVFRSITEAIEGLKRVLQAGVSVESAHVNCKNRLGFYTHAYREKHGRDPDIPAWADAVLFVTINGDKPLVEFSRTYAINQLKKMGGVLIKEQDIIDSWWASKHTLQFLPMKQKWPDSQRKKKFGAADLGIPIGRIEEAYRYYQQIAQQFKIEILGMCVYNERPNRISPSISFAVFVDDSNPDEVRNFYSYVREMSKMAVEMEGTMSTYIGDGDRLGEFNRLEHGDALDFMKKLKALFDPNNILNPGKKFESKWIT